jgi:uncharacterized protein (DUF1501 family)
MAEPNFYTRREFLRSLLLGIAASSTVPAFVWRTFEQAKDLASGRWRARRGGGDLPILVLIQLAGGNDGLNTLIPYQNDHYYRARPTLSEPGRKAIPLIQDLGLHPALGPLKELYEEGDLAIIQGVGYPNPNRSHFRATEIWESGTGKSVRRERTGWIGRYFDACCQGEEPLRAFAFANEPPLALEGRAFRGITVSHPGFYRLPEMLEHELGERDNCLQFFGKGAFEASKKTSSPAPVGATSCVSFIERMALDGIVGSEKVASALKTNVSPTTYPNSRLGLELSWVARMIVGGLPTQVYYVSQGGYDTHVHQLAQHSRLLSELASALQAFATDLKARGSWDRVLVVTFSEFGRRVKENASLGTDHGAGSVQFILGGSLRAGLYGTYPLLEPEKLLAGDLGFSVDFRCVYATVLERWLKLPSEPVLGGHFELVDFLA